MGKGNPNKQEFPPLLGVGFHTMDMAALRKLCVESFPASKRRSKIMLLFEEIVQKIIAERIESKIWIDGSFMTKKTDPLDVDICLCIQSVFVDNANIQQQDVLKWINGDLSNSHLCDSYIFVEYPKGHKREAETTWGNAYWIRQFGFTRKDEHKGIAVIETP